MRHCVWCFLVYSWLIPIPLSTAASQPTSEGHPHKWDTVEKGMADFIADGFELKSVVYDSSESPKGEPDVHYFFAKGYAAGALRFSATGPDFLLLVRPVDDAAQAVT